MMRLVKQTHVCLQRADMYDLKLGGSVRGIGMQPKYVRKYRRSSIVAHIEVQTPAPGITLHTLIHHICAKLPSNQFFVFLS